MAKYNSEIVDKICGFLSEGKTRQDAFMLAGIGKQTFYTWLETKQDFSDAVKKAEATYQEWEMHEMAATAKKSLKELITGGEYEEVRTEYENDGTGTPRIKKQVRTMKRVGPNPTAVIFALTNRDPEHWQNRISQDFNGKMNVEHEGGGVSLANVPDDLLAKVIDAINGK